VTVYQPALHYDHDGCSRCGHGTRLTTDQAAVTCGTCTLILAGPWGGGQPGREWADRQPHGTPAAARRHYRLGHKPLRWFCRTCSDAVARDRADRYAREKTAA
jgi:ribosomal protein S27AE